MRFDKQRGRIWFGVGVLLLLATGVMLLLLIAGGGWVYQAADYPGAMLVSDHTNYTGLTIRRDTSYRTQDPFPDVYNWYSVGFSLGPEKAAQSNCIYMEESAEQLIFSRQMAVHVCDTVSGRLIFVQRTVTIH